MRRPAPESERQEIIAAATADCLKRLSKRSSDSSRTLNGETSPTKWSSGARAIGPRPAAVLRLFVKKVADSGIEARFEWRANEVRRASLSPQKAKALSDWLGSVEYAQAESALRGTLEAADRNKGTFTLRDGAGRTYAGRTNAEVVDHAEIGGLYECRIRVITSIAEHTGLTVERYELLELRENRES